jgi:hypothetical protein
MLQYHEFTILPYIWMNLNHTIKNERFRLLATVPGPGSLLIRVQGSTWVPSHQGSRQYVDRSLANLMHHLLVKNTSFAQC